VTYRDGNALHAAGIAKRSLLMYKSGAVLDSGRAGAKPFHAVLRVTTGSFFPMFDVPFQYGNGWDAAADEGPAPVVVLSDETNRKAFAGENSVGRTVRLGDTEFRVVGVMKPWAPSPKFYDLNNGSFEDAEDAFIPFRWGPLQELAVYGNTNCWKSETIASYGDFLNSECVWLQMWAELPTTQDRDRFQSYLDNYARSQKAARTGFAAHRPKR
jgi:putative ABC transport system permease protein